jgi:putative phage-type endonuclease
MTAAERAAWLEERRSGIGGTDAAAILGMSKFATPFDVYTEKMGPVEPKEDTERMFWGRALEDVIAQRYSALTGRTLLNPEKAIRHPEHPVLMGTPDRLVVGESRGVEIKNVGAESVDEWGEPGTDEVPPGYLIQSCHYLLVTGLDAWDVVPLFSGNELAVYTVHRDDEFLEKMRATLLSWWRRHVVAGIPPEVTGADSTRDMLSRRFPRDAGMTVEATECMNAVAERLHLARIEQARAEAVRAECENQLKAFMGDGSGVVGRGWRATWRSTREVEKVDWHELATEAVAQLDKTKKFDRARFLARFTTRKPGPRRFLFTGPKEN